MIDQNTRPSEPLVQACFANGMAYAVGRLDASQITPLTGRLDNGQTYTVLIPSPVFPQMVRRNPDFLYGCECGYTGYDEASVTILSAVNKVTHTLYENLREPFGTGMDGWFWAAGYALGWLARVAEQDVRVAHVGLAHLCFALTHLHPSFMGYRPALLWALYQCSLHHTLAMKAYRARVRELTTRGLDLPSAYVRALILYTGSDRSQKRPNAHKGVVLPCYPCVQQ